MSNNIKCIYKIINKNDNKFYIGSTKNFKKRKLVHLLKLKNQTHHCIHLQRAVNKYGIENFDFLIIEECENYKEVEQDILNNLDYSKVYNVSKSASGGDLIHNHPNRDELIKSATSRLLTCKKPTPKFKEENGNWKGGISKNQCLDCSKLIKAPATRCAKCYYKHRDITKEKNPFFQKKHSEETKNKIRLQKLGKRNINQEKPVIIDDIEYVSLSEAGRQLNINLSTLLFRIRSKNLKFEKYNYK